MKTSEEKLKNFEAIISNFPCLLVEEFTKKELTDKDCYYLRYCLMRFIFKNQGLIWEYTDQDPETVYYNVDEEASICDNSLCIGDFEGYKISETKIIKALELSQENRCILNVYNLLNDSFENYLID
jgi:hypothetical protein